MATSKSASKSRAMTAPERGNSGMTGPMSKEERERYLAKMTAKGYEGVDAENYEDGGATSKQALVDQEFKILLAEFLPSTKNPGGEYVVCHCMLAATGEVVVISDGGKGIYEPIRKHVDEGKTFPLLVKQGLKRSDYPANDKRPAGTTFWLNGKSSDADIEAAGSVTRSSAAGKAGVANGRARA